MRAPAGSTWLSEIAHSGALAPGTSVRPYRLKWGNECTREHSPDPIFRCRLRPRFPVIRIHLPNATSAQQSGMSALVGDFFRKPAPFSEVSGGQALIFQTSSKRGGCLNSRACLRCRWAGGPVAEIPCEVQMGRLKNIVSSKFAHARTYSRCL